MRPSLVLCLASLWIAGSASMAYAQLIDGPPGAVGGLFGGRRPVDPNRNSQQFDALFNFSGGFDRDPTLLATNPGLDGQASNDSQAMTGSALARYRVGSIRRSLEARGRGYVNYWSNAAETLPGGEASLSTSMRFGRRRLNAFGLEVQSSYEPGWVFGALGPSTGESADSSSLNVATPQGVIEQRWLVVAGSASYEHHLTTRNIATFQYRNRRLRPIDGGGLDSDLQSATVDYRWDANPGLAVVGGYALTGNQQRDGDTELPLVRYQTLDAGFTFSRRRSATRRMSATTRVGATRVMESPGLREGDALQPSINATVDFATSRFWTLTVQGGRQVTVMAGLSALPVLNDNVTVTFNGTPTRKLQYSVFASRARATSVTSNPLLENVTNVSGATGELRYAIATWAAVFGSYGYYHHRIEDASLTASGFPPRYDRRSIRFGMTFWMPLYGAF